MAKELSNYIPLNRRFFAHHFWQEQRIYSKAEAWLDLLQSARFEVSQGKMLKGSKMITWDRGEVYASVRYLGSAWSWSNGKVLRFLEMLEQENMITRRQCNGETIITLCNYDSYNGWKISTERQMEHGTEQQNTVQQRILVDKRNTERNSNRHRGGTEAEQRRNETNIENIEKKEEDGPPIPARVFSDEQKENFKNFQIWVAKFAPRVAEMKEPVTIEQFTALKERGFNMVRIRELLLDMHNWVDLHKKRISAYLTLLNWKRRGEE